VKLVGMKAHIIAGFLQPLRIVSYRLPVHHVSHMSMGAAMTSIWTTLNVVVSAHTNDAVGKKEVPYDDRISEVEIVC
jgi:hypothetical protein